MERLLGAHTSIAGGYHKAVERAAGLGMSTCQIFTKNNSQWQARRVEGQEVERFQTALTHHGVTRPTAHCSYLINLASPDRRLWKKSVDALVIELQRAEALGIRYLVLHPGAHTTASESKGIRNVVRALDESHRQTRGIHCRCLLETTAGQGTSLGWKFEQLAAMLDRVRAPDRLGVCLDTCHVFAAGYPLSTEKEYRATMRAFDKLVGLSRLKVIHLNDSKRELGSRVDRHQHIGQGCLGSEAFRLLLNDRRFRNTPMYLETPKGKRDEDGQDWDAVNLHTLRALIR